MKKLPLSLARQKAAFINRELSGGRTVGCCALMSRALGEDCFLNFADFLKIDPIRLRRGRPCDARIGLHSEKSQMLIKYIRVGDSRQTRTDDSKSQAIRGSRLCDLSDDRLRNAIHLFNHTDWVNTAIYDSSSAFALFFFSEIHEQSSE